jgi:hypothetical protein
MEESALKTSVTHTLMRMRGIWHDKIKLYELDGESLAYDALAGSPGRSPFENLVYIDFDGATMTQTNVTFRGRELSVKTFSGHIQDGVLIFDSLGSGAYENIGMSAGPGAIIYSASHLSEACQRYFEPDFIQLTSSETRIRSTVLYRDGNAARTLSAEGVRLSTCCRHRHDWDPRGLTGSVHEVRTETNVWQ